MPRPVEHRRGVLGEAAARVAAVEADDDPAGARVGAAARRLVEEVRAEPPGGLHDREPVHPREPRLDAPAEARGAELERARHAVGQVRPRRLVPALGAAHERLELGARLGVGVLGQELAGGGDGVAHAAHSTAGLRSGMLATALLPALLAAAPAPVDPALAERFARLALACVHQEYPNKIAHVMSRRRGRAPPAGADAGLLRLLRLALLGPRPLAARAASRACCRRRPSPPRPAARWRAA